MTFILFIFTKNTSIILSKNRPQWLFVFILMLANMIGVTIMKRNDPPIDWIKAIVLERINQFGFTQQDVSAISGISVPTLRNCMRSPVASWNPKYRKAIFRALRIRMSDLPEIIRLSATDNIDEHTNRA